ncbi:hypothetical protein FJ960_07655 [Mesorhizobium sp. B2-3-11]|nr:hypothetical protein FJ960_07655 [Mesorhizobium sp. B2-3-11]
MSVVIAARGTSVMQHITALAECRELQVPVSVFATADECNAERPFAMGDVQGQAQHFVTECLAVDPASEDEYDQIVCKMRPDGSLNASLTISDLSPGKDDVNQQ